MEEISSAEVLFTDKYSKTMSNKVCDVLKWIAMVVLPAIGTAYAGLAVIWDFPYGEELLGTIGIAEVFLGSILQISSEKYKEKAK